LRETTGFLNLMLHIFTGYLYSSLYHFIPGVNWLGWFMAAFTFCIVTVYNALIFHLVRHDKKRLFQPLLFILFSVLFYVAFIIEQVFMLNSTKISVSLSLVSFLGMLMLMKNHQKMDRYRLLLTACVILYFLGWTMRLNVIFLLIPILTWFSFSYLSFKPAVRTMALTLIICLGTIAGGWSILNTDQKQSLRKTMQVEREILGYLDGPYKSDFSIKTCSMMNAT